MKRRTVLLSEEAHPGFCRTMTINGEIWRYAMVAGYGRLLSGVILLTLVIVPAGVAIGATTPSSSAGQVFIDVQATCPAQPKSGLSILCRRSRAGNASTRSFATRHSSWGVAYAFNCGQRAGRFYLTVGLPAMDGDMPSTDIARWGKEDRGYHMVTPAAYRDLTGIPAMWAGIQNIEIKSICTWHIVAVAGPASAVALHIPPIPPARHA